MPINHNEIAGDILKQFSIITFADTKEIYAYNSEEGLYKPFDTKIEQLVQNELGEDCKTHIVNEVKESIKRQTYIERESIGAELNLIPLKNCVFDMKTETTLPYSPEHKFLSKHNITYFPDIITEGIDYDENPIDKFINEITERQEDALLLKEIAGYCFYRKYPFQNFFILVGKGGNGKSVYLNVLRKMLGEDNVSNQSLQALTEGGFAIATLYSKNANVFGDLPKKAFQDVGVIKELTGGDMIEANQKFKGYLRFRNYAKLISSCNEVPETPDQTDGFYRRALIINFPYCFEGRENRNLLEELTTPENMWKFFKSSINAFKLALEANNWVRSESIESKRDRYMIYSNSAIAFCHAHLDYDPEEMLPSQEIYEKYTDYCKVNKTAAKDEIRFFKSLYLHFGNKVWKKRIVDSYEDKTIRRYVIQGVYWKK